MTFVNLRNLLDFSTNGVSLRRECLSVLPAELYDAIRIAYSHIENDEVLALACQGFKGPLAGLGEVSYESYLEILRQFEVDKAGQTAKRSLTRQRRSEYGSKRPHLELQMIDAGVPYVCCVVGCDTMTELTLDHIVPLSRGGTDEISNLTFMCRSHNSTKGDKHNSVKGDKVVPFERYSGFRLGTDK
jgi:hypothetical protein